MDPVLILKDGGSEVSLLISQSFVVEGEALHIGEGIILEDTLILPLFGVALLDIQQLFLPFYTDLLRQERFVFGGGLFR
jgi:hypothetical protein